MKKNPVFILLFLAAVPVLAFAQQPKMELQALSDSSLTLQQCVETAINNNLDVLQSQLELQTAKINWNQARLNQLPDLGATAASGINTGRSIDPFSNAYSNETINYSSYNLSSGVVLFNGGALRNLAKQNQLGYEAARMDWQQAKDNVTIDVILAYLEVLRSEDLLRQSIQQAELSLKQVERLEILNSEGAVKPTDLYDLRGQYANDKLSIITATNSLGTAKVALCRLMNVQYRSDLNLQRIDDVEFAESYEGTPAQIYDETLKEFALVKAVDLRKQSALRGVRANRSALFPTLSLNGGIGTQYSSAARNNVFVNTTEVPSENYVLVGGTPYNLVVKQDNFNQQKIAYNKQLNNNLSNSISLNLRIPIFGNWQQRNRIKLAEVQLKNAEFVQKTTVTQLQQSVEQAHLNLVAASNRFHTLTEQLNAYREFFRASEILFNEGVGTSIDYLTAKNKLDQSNINSIVARYDYVLRTKVLDYYRGRKLW
ncbi:MAG: TolC family protein [Chitinophagaceae bacterium]|nr:MAG: TolC family protein [Chitinophagaceae bacterium]